MTLTKRIPSRTLTIKAEWCKIDFAVMCPIWRSVRASARNKLDKCYWCKHKFADGEAMAMAKIKGIAKNQVFCQECGGKLVSDQ